MTVIFAANVLDDSPKTVSLTGGLFDRLKGLSTYLRLCKIFSATPVVIWDSPYKFGQIFSDCSSLSFNSRQVLRSYYSYSYINLLNDRPKTISFNQIATWFSATENFIIFSNTGLTSQPWENLRAEFTSKFPDKVGLLKDALPHQILFDDFDLRFQKPTRRFYRVRNTKRLCFHFRIGGNQDCWNDPLLADEELVLSKAIQYLEFLASRSLGLTLEVAIAGDSDKIKEIIRRQAKNLGFGIVGYEDPVLHIDRSSMIESSTAELILQDIDLIASSDFLLTTAGAFGVMSAKYGKVPHGRLLNQSSLRACLEILTAPGNPVLIQ